MSSVEITSRRTHTLTFRGLIRSEWTKLWSLRVPGWIALAMVFAPVLLGMIRAAATTPAAEATSITGTAAALESAAVGVIPLGFLAAVFGLVSMGSEYVDDSLSVTLSVAPRRMLVLIAKCLPMVGVTAAAALLGLSGSAGMAWVLLSTRGYDSLPAAGLATTVILGTVSTALVALIGVGCTAIHRSSLSASMHLGVLLALAPTAIALIAGPNAHVITDLLPGTSLQAIATQPPGAPFTIQGAPPSGLPRWAGMLVLTSWAATYVSAGLVLIRRRAVSPRQAMVPARKARRIKSLAPQHPRLTVIGVLRSEALKFLTLPSTQWLLALSSMSIVGLAILQASRTRPSDLLASPISAHDLEMLSSDQQTQIVAAGIGITQILLAFLGALAFTSEFASGNIRPTLLAVPNRSVVFIAKSAVVASAIVVATTLATLLAAGIAQPIEQANGFVVSLNNASLIETVFRCVVVSTAVGLLGCGIGALLRSAIPAVGTLIGILVLSHTALGPMQTATRGTPFVWLANLNEFFPYPVRAVVTLSGDYYWPHVLDGNVLQLDPTQVLVVTMAWAGFATIAGYFTFRTSAI